MHKRHQFVKSGFSMIELLVSIVIVAVIAAVALFAYISLTTWATQTKDKEVLTVLNDALSRYKTEGGSLAALTASAPVGDVLYRMAKTINWNGMVHQVLQKGVTYPSRSISAAGNGTDYHFTRYNTYNETNPALGVPSTTYPYGQGVAYASNNNNVSGYSVQVETDGGPFVIQDSNGNYYYGNNGATVDTSPAQSIKVWACVATGNPAFAGNIIAYLDDGGSDNDFDSNLVTLDVTGLTQLVGLYCGSNQGLTTMNVSGLTQLQYLDFAYTAVPNINVSGCSSLQYFSIEETVSLISLNASGCSSLTTLDCDSYYTVNSLNVSGCSALTYLNCSYNALTSLNLSGLSSLQSLACNNNSISSLDLSGCPQLQTLTCSYNGLTSLNLSVCPTLNYLQCRNNSLTSLNCVNMTNLQTLICRFNSLTYLGAKGCTAVTMLRCDNNQLTSLDVTGDTLLPAPSTTTSNFWVDAALMGHITGP